MPRKHRFYIPGAAVHIVQRGHRRDAIFFDDSDYLCYLNCLSEALERYPCDMHAYVLMTNHVHFLATPKNQETLSCMMQHISRRYVPYINSTYGRSGTLWEGRYKASLVQDDHYLIGCMRYIELNPVRAAMVKSAAHYRWSSYSFNALGKDNSLITPHDLYERLARTDSERQEMYRKLFLHHMDSTELDEINSAWQTGTPLGNDKFREQVEETLKLKVGHVKRGRPLKGV